MEWMEEHFRSGTVCLDTNFQYAILVRSNSCSFASWVHRPGSKQSDRRMVWIDNMLRIK